MFLGFSRSVMVDRLAAIYSCFCAFFATHPRMPLKEAHELLRSACSWVNGLDGFKNTTKKH